eukprot:gene2208-2977_t
MRGLIGATLRRDPEIEVVGFAADPHEARAAIKALNPDVITLDIEMPNMNGLEFLEKIMRLRPMPVVMLSTLTLAGAEATLRALELGAVDCIAKPAGPAQGGDALGELAARVKAAAAARVRPIGQPGVSRPPPRSYRPSGHLVAIGSSTGGVEALLTVIASFPKDCPPAVGGASGNRGRHMQSAIVLGAGMAGVGIAVQLQRRGWSVALVDERGPGEATSYGNAGIIQSEAVE